MKRSDIAISLRSIPRFVLFRTRFARTQRQPLTFILYPSSFELHHPFPLVRSKYSKYGAPAIAAMMPTGISALESVRASVSHHIK